MTVSTSKNVNITVAEPPFARGGEGTVHDVVGKSDLVAKIYHKSGRTRERGEKLLAMIASPPQGNTAKQIAWPVDVLIENGEIIGFLMSRIQNVSKIDAVYSNDSSDKYPYRFFIHVAKNLCAAVHSIHESGHAIGDLNPANICVDLQTGLVTLVDTDSYNIVDKNGKVFRCCVCRPEYAPAEIHQIMNNQESLRTTNMRTFDVYTDLFALAVHIFSLLMNGCHPYAARVVSHHSASTFNINSNIINGIFPYVIEETDVEPPLYAPSILALPKVLQDYFILSFWSKKWNQRERRITPQMWYDALEELEKNLQTCPKKGHSFYSGAKTCPFCDRDEIIKQATKKSRGPSIISVPPPPVSTNPSPPQPSKPISSRFYFAQTAKERVLFIIGIVAGLIYMAGVSVGVLLGLTTLFDFAWWLSIILFFLFGVIVFVPMWLFAFINHKFSLTSKHFFAGMASLLDRSFYAAVAMLSIVAIADTWGSGFFNMIFTLVIINIPVFLIKKYLPGLTENVI